MTEALTVRDVFPPNSESITIVGVSITLDRTARTPDTFTRGMPDV